ncbi:hypothetical protein ACHAQA_001453 [Verticillium albo-atrum]
MVSHLAKGGRDKQNSKSVDVPREERQPTPPNAEEPLLFYMPNAKYGELCQWYPSKFTISEKEVAAVVSREVQDTNPGDERADDDAIMFNCAEQFMMYCKAARFGDRQGQARIMATDSPKEQKRLGKQIIGFTDESWDQVKSEVVTVGNLAKFRQDIRLRRRLLATGDRMLCEAASKDRVWGIGYNAKTAMSQRKHWGENRLGKALMAVRDILRAEDDTLAEAI